MALMLWNDEFHLKTKRTRHVKLFSNIAWEIIVKARRSMQLLLRMEQIWLLPPVAKVHGRKLLTRKHRIPRKFQ